MQHTLWGRVLVQHPASQPVIVSGLMKSPQAVVVIPCYNEADRLHLAAFQEFLENSPSVHLLLVNDGSMDSTLAVLETLANSFPEQVQVIDQQPNKGKAEAVRVGLLAACEQAPIVGFWDADLATPLHVIDQFLSIMRARPEIQWVLGSRVKLLGRQIRRSELRHYLGRVFATGASLTLSLGVYDTQCGAKMFRSTQLLGDILARPFLTRWIFDVELIARLTAAHRRNEAPAPSEMIFEAPLDTWQDVAGSKVSGADFLRSGLELFRVWWQYLRKA